MQTVTLSESDRVWSDVVQRRPGYEKDVQQMLMKGFVTVSPSRNTHTQCPTSYRLFAESPDSHRDFRKGFGILLAHFFTTTKTMGTANPLPPSLKLVASLSICLAEATWALYELFLGTSLPLRQGSNPMPDTWSCDVPARAHLLGDPGT